MVALEKDLEAVREDTSECRTGVERIQSSLEKRNEQRETERKEAVAERKSDRRWLTGTILTSAGLVIAGVGLLADKL
jgi:hypothetical protein